MNQLFSSENGHSPLPLHSSAAASLALPAVSSAHICHPESLETEAIHILWNDHTRTMVRNSADLKWPNMYAALINTQPLEELIPPTSFLLFAIPLQNLDALIEINDRTYRGKIAANSHSIIAPGVKYDLNFMSPCSFLYVCINKDVLADVAGELFHKRLDEIDMFSPMEETDPGLQCLLNVCMLMLTDTHDSSFRSDYIARAITAQFYSKHTQLRDTPRAEESRIAFSGKQVQRINEYLQTNLHDTFQVADMAASIGMSRTIFFERFIHTMKKTPNQYLQVLRVNRAKELLADRKLALTDIAAACGYADQPHFARFFKRFIGVSPGKYRQEISS